MYFFASVLAVVLATLLMSSGAVAPGYRMNSCSFGYNNVYYIIGGSIYDGNNSIPATNFISAPLPLAQVDSILWSALPDPPLWQNMSAVDSTPQFHCAVNYDGKAFLFGNAVGFAVFDIPTGVWSTAPPTFSSSISMSNLLNQQGIGAAVGPDGYTISIFATTPPMYMELNSRTMAMDGVAVTGFPANMHGFCMDVMSTTPPMPIVCGGSNGGAYSNSCWQLGLGASSSKTLATLSQPQDGCTLIAYSSHFIIWPGYLSTYHTPSLAPISSAYNPDMTRFDLSTSAWTSVPNLQGQNYLPLTTYMAYITMPGTSTSVFFGGQNPVSSGVSRAIYYFNLQSNTWVSSVGQASNPFPTPIAPSPSSQSSSSSPSGVPSHSPSPVNPSHSNTGAIIGGVVGGLAVVAALVAFLFWNRRKAHQGQGTHHVVESNERPSNVEPESNYMSAQGHDNSKEARYSMTPPQSPARNPQATMVSPNYRYRAAPQDPQGTS